MPTVAHYSVDEPITVCETVCKRRWGFSGSIEGSLIIAHRTKVALRAHKRQAEWVPDSLRDTRMCERNKQRYDSLTHLLISSSPIELEKRHIPHHSKELSLMSLADKK